MSDRIQAIREALAEVQSVLHLRAPEVRHEWHFDYDEAEDSAIVYYDIDKAQGHISVLFESDWATEEDARFVATCNPLAISELLKAHDEAARRADEAERAANAEARLADQAAAAMQERCAQLLDTRAEYLSEQANRFLSEGLMQKSAECSDCAAAIRSLSSTTGVTNKD